MKTSTVTPDTIRENGGDYTTGASDGHMWNVKTGECSPLCPADGGHARSLISDVPMKTLAELLAGR